MSGGVQCAEASVPPTSVSRDDVRAMIADCRLDFDAALDPPGVRRLVSLLNAEMTASGAVHGTLRMRRCMKRGRNATELRCKAFYFGDREAVTFHADGFVGFAGWADDKNVAPVLAGFMKWLSGAAA